MGFKTKVSRKDRTAGDTRTLKRAPNLVLPLLGRSFSLLSCLAVQVLAAKAGLAAQLGKSGPIQTTRFLQAKQAPETYAPTPPATTPASTSPRPPKQEFKTSLLPSGGQLPRGSRRIFGYRLRNAVLASAVLLPPLTKSRYRLHWIPLIPTMPEVKMANRRWEWQSDWPD